MRDLNYMIAVMQAAKDGKAIEVKGRDGILWTLAPCLCWDITVREVLPE